MSVAPPLQREPETTVPSRCGPVRGFSHLCTFSSLKSRDDAHGEGDACDDALKGTPGGVCCGLGSNSGAGGCGDVRLRQQMKTTTTTAMATTTTPLTMPPIAAVGRPPDWLFWFMLPPFEFEFVSVGLSVNKEARKQGKNYYGFKSNGTYCRLCLFRVGGWT
jgi:hypothetical protein